MKSVIAAFAFLALTAVGARAEAALDGRKSIVLHTRDGKELIIGTVDFTPEVEGSTFAVTFDDSKFAPFFLSMRDFKCIEGDAILCRVPYPYPSPHKVTASDLSWLEHALLFLYKRPGEYANGLIYTLKIDGPSLVGTPQSIDLDEIAAPPENPGVAYFGKDQRYDPGAGAGWIVGLSIEARR